MDASRSPAQVAALVLGAWWVSNGIGALLIDPNFSTDHVHGGGSALGLLTITANGWHGLFHLLTGLLGLAVWRRRRASVAYVLGVGAIYVVFGVWGLATGGNTLGVIAVDHSGDVVHIVEGLLAVSAGVFALAIAHLGRGVAPRAAAE